MKSHSIFPRYEEAKAKMSKLQCREARNKYYSKRMPKAARKLDLDKG